MSTATRPTLLGRLRDASDAMAWDEFFACYWPTIFGYARRRGASEQTAEELVQDVMLAVFQQRDVFRYDPARGRFRDWLRRVVANRLAERRRRPSERARAAGGNGGNDRLDVADEEPAVDEAWETAFEQSLLSTLVDAVRRESNPREFVAFELTMLHGRRPAEAARLTGMTRNMVYKARRKITERLRELAGGYATDGRLCDEVRRAMQSRPGRAVERSLTTRMEKTMR
ncbi:MAG TPA: sigma-70 family RNA polymerase sigma factor [Thermoguttaceae bacterium]|nr:sigma-70 family RNA polymerase sigma factor [Thermoguttaceae bacterium]